ncbi:MAG: AcrR family transcriptional regulator [Acidimicrobiales bacterium]|jgi:AcrR family transcriptional regulator
MARPLSTQAREKALDAAREVIALDGIEGFTVDAVAKRSGVAKTTIYRHFSTGNELLIHAVDCMVHPLPTPNTGSLAGDIDAFMRSVLAILEDDGMRRTILGVISASISDPGLKRVHQEMMGERMTPIKTILELAQGRGELAADLDLDLAIDFIEGPFFFRKLVRQDALDDEQIRVLAKMIVSGLQSLSIQIDPNE